MTLSLAMGEEERGEETDHRARRVKDRPEKAWYLLSGPGFCPWSTQHGCTLGWAGRQEAQRTWIPWDLHQQECSGETASSKMAFSERAPLYWRNKGYINLGERVGVFRVSVHDWLVPRRWEGFICMKRDSSCLLDMFLQGERKLSHQAM